jgi:hypothetical protein
MNVRWGCEVQAIVGGLPLQGMEGLFGPYELAEWISFLNVFDLPARSHGNVA